MDYSIMMTLHATPMSFQLVSPQKTKELDQPPFPSLPPWRRPTPTGAAEC